MFLVTSILLSLTVNNFPRYHFEDYQNVNASSMGWTLENGYSESEEIDTYPRRALLAGAKNALQLTLLTRKADIDYVCKNGLQGFKVRPFFNIL